MNWVHLFLKEVMTMSIYQLINLLIQVGLLVATIIMAAK